VAVPESEGAPGQSPTVKLRRAGLPRGVLELCERLDRAGHRAWVVGGSVRDSLLAQLRGEPQGWHAKDWDLATDATPDQITPLFRRVIPTGVEHGTVTVLLGGLTLELTTLRAERSYSDGRRPERVDFVSTIEEDLSRRDFTVNAIAFDPVSEALIDPFGGLADLQARRLRAVGEASRRFAEDGLRVLRAARLTATLEFELEPETARAIAPSLDTYRRVSAERIREEWNKVFSLARVPSRAFAAMHTHGLLAITAPELDALARVPPASSPAGHASALHLSWSRLDRMPADIELRLTALLRDVHPEPTRAAEQSDQLLARLRYSNAERKQVTHLVRHPLPPLDTLDTAASLRRWLRRIGPEQHPRACQLERAHRQALAAPETELAALDDFQARADAELARNPPLTLSALAIDGQQLMAEAGYRPGRDIGLTLEALLEHVLDDPAQNDPAHLLALARELRERQTAKATRS
jgi:tRNA nucleotidyltransferase (CCA-adding enzyme)